MLSDIGSARCRRIAGAVTSELRGHRAVAAVRSFLDRTDRAGNRAYVKTLR